MDANKSGDKASRKNNNSLLDCNGILPMESMEDDGLLLTDLDYELDHGWGSFSTGNLWTSHDFSAEASMSSLEALTSQSASELAQSQQVFPPSNNTYVFGSNPQRGRDSGDMVKDGYFSEEMENLNEDDEGSVRSSQSARSAEGRTLISERRRRGRLNERLYALRALVPKITKMDKASIVGDAISYVQDLQKEVEDIQADITRLESDIMDKDSVFGAGNLVMTDADLQIPSHEKGSISSYVHKPGRKIILEVDVSKVEERTFHIRIYCEKRSGVLIELTRALESLHLEFQNVNLTSFHSQIIKTATIKMNKCDSEIQSETVKRIILEAAAKHGFETAENTRSS
ncbi:hypothetical protein SUGI_0660060 [Cryptomeria japonica]|uniref:transcription factor bHLH35 n=1 Tax=Cryptomeria japonica TaxID=3369 RepID=UPI002414C942|nr:transcription factor bHLH35 [Cryptomeria japonica]GLJ32781.1 hypothetical protein SUGI_0660060 [Cryptomeria japonica]